MRIGHTTKCLDHGHVKLLNVAGSDQEIVRHARISTGRNDENRTEADDKKLLNYLYKNRHTSPFEMAKVWLEIQLPIFVWRQWARHRTQNMNEVSGRYTELPDIFYIPEKWRQQAETNKQSSVDVGQWNPLIQHNDLCAEAQTATEHVEGLCRMAYTLYEQMIKAGVAKEQARIILPLNIYTKMHVCFDLHNLIHFIRLRDDSHAQSEIQVYGKAIRLILLELFPWTMAAYGRYKLTVLDTENEEVTPKAGVHKP